MHSKLPKGPLEVEDLSTDVTHITGFYGRPFLSVEAEAFFLVSILRIVVFKAALGTPETDFQFCCGWSKKV